MIIDVQGVGQVEFPDEMSSEEIDQAILGDIYPAYGIEPPDKGGFWSGAKRGFLSGIDTMQAETASGLQGLTKSMGFDTASQDLQGFIDRQREEARQENPDPARFEEMEDLNDWLRYFGEQTGTSAAITGTGIGAAGLGFLATGSAPLALAAGATALTPFYYGSNRELQKDLNEGTVPDEVRAAVAAPVMAAADVALGAVGIAPALARRLATRVIASMGLGAMVEAPTEIFQEVAQRWQAKEDLFSDEAIEAYKQVGITAAVLGGGFGAVAGVPKRTGPMHDAPPRPPLVVAEAEEGVNGVPPIVDPDAPLALPHPSIRTADPDFIEQQQARREAEAVERVVEGLDLAEADRTALLQVARRASTPLARFPVSALSDEVATRAAQRAAGRGQYAPTEFTIAEILEAGASPQEVDALLTQAVPIPATEAPSVDEIDALAQEKNIITRQKGRRSEAFKEFSRQMVGSRDVDKLTDVQRAALHEIIGEMPTFNQPVEIPWVQSPSYSVEAYEAAERAAIEQGSINLQTLRMATKPENKPVLPPKVLKELRADLVKNGVVYQVGKGNEYRLRQETKDPRDIVPPPAEEDVRTNLAPDEEYQRREYAVEETPTTVKGKKPEYAVVGRAYKDFDLLAKEPILTFPTREEAEKAASRLQAEVAAEGLRKKPAGAPPLSRLRELGRQAAEAPVEETPAGPRAPLPAESRRRVEERIIPALKARGAQRGLPGVGASVRLVSSIKAYLGDGAPEGILEGAVDNVSSAEGLRKTILLAWDAIPNIDTATDNEIIEYLGGVMDHELVHALMQTGVITDAQWKTLYEFAQTRTPPGSTQSYLERAQESYGQEAAAAAEDQALTGQAAQDFYKQYVGEEAIAEVFRDFAADPNNVNERVRGVFRHIIEVLRRLISSFRDAGYQSAEEILRDIETGAAVRKAQEERRVVRGGQQRRFSRRSPEENIKTLRGMQVMSHFAGDKVENVLSDVQDPMSRSTIVLMSPDDFIDMATKGLHSPGREEVYAQNLSRGMALDELPYLRIENDQTGQIGDHEGRHRSWALKAKAHEYPLMPVELRASSLRWGTSPIENRPKVLKSQQPGGRTMTAPDSVVFPAREGANIPQDLMGGRPQVMNVGVAPQEATLTPIAQDIQESFPSATLYKGKALDPKFLRHAVPRVFASVADAARQVGAKEVINADALGAYGTWDPELSSGLAASFPYGTQPEQLNSVAAEVFRIAKQEQQSEAFVALEALDDFVDDPENPTLRPGISIFFRSGFKAPGGKSETEILELINNLKTQKIGGFTVFSSEPRPTKPPFDAVPEAANRLYEGMNFIWTPEYTGEDVGDINASLKGAADDMLKIAEYVEKNKIGSASIKWYHALLTGDPDYDQTIQSLAPSDTGGPTEAFGVLDAGWRKPIVASVQDAASRDRRRKAQQQRDELRRGDEGTGAEGPAQEIGQRFSRRVREVQEAVGPSPTAELDRKLLLHPAVRRAIESPEFQEWFGNSIMVDQNGFPMIWYHATNSPRDFESFDPLVSDPTAIASFFTSDPVFANDWIDVYRQRGRIIPVFLSLQRPFNPSNRADLQSVSDWMRDNQIDWWDDAAETDLAGGHWTRVEDPMVQMALFDLGYDSFIAEEWEATNIGVFDFDDFNPIKSIFNKGSWDPEDSRIRYSRRVRRKTKEGLPSRDPRFRGPQGKLFQFEVTLQRPGKKNITRVMFATDENDARGKAYASPSMMRGASEIISVKRRAKTGKYSMRNPPGERVPRFSAQDGRSYENTLVRHRSQGRLTRFFQSDDPINFFGWKLPSPLDMRIRLQDKMLPIGMLQDRIMERGGIVDDNFNTYMMEQLSHGKTVHEIRENEDKMYLPLLRAIKAAPGIQRGDVEDYLYAMHAPSRNAALLSRMSPEMQAETPAPSGMTDAEAADVLAKLKQEGKLPQLQRLADMAYAIIQNTNKVRLENGLIDEAMLNEPWENYVPLRGFADEDVDADAVMPRTGKRGGIRGKEDKSATGRRTKANDILGHIFIQNEEAIIRANRNQVIKSFADMIRANENQLGDLAQVLDSYPMERVRSRSGKIQLKPNQRATQTPDVVAYKEIGKDGRVQEVRVRTQDPRLAQALSGVGTPDSSGYLVTTLGKVNRFLAHVNTSYNPEFVLSNLFKDIQTAGIVASQYEVDGLVGDIMKPGNIAAAMRGIEAVLRKDKAKISGTGQGSALAQQFADDFRRLQKLGGTTEFLGIKDLNSILDNINHELEEKMDSPHKLLRGSKKAWQAISGLVEDYNKVAENAMRLGVFSSLIRKGISDKQAAFVAKNLTVNFNKGGTHKAGMNAAYLFYNASLQGTWVMMNAMRSKKVQKIIAGIVAAGFLQDTVNSIIGLDDDGDGRKDYDEIDDWVKEHNIVFAGPDGFQGKVPMPYGFNSFYNLGRNLSALARGATTPAKAAQSITLSFFDSFNPLGGSNNLVNWVAPTILDPAIDIYANRDFAGRPIQPERVKSGTQPSEPSSQLYWNNTNPIFVGVADWLNRLTLGNEFRAGAIDVSPNQLEHVFDYVGGATSTFLLRTFTPEKTGENVIKLIQGDFEDLDLNSVVFLRKLVGNTGNIQDRRQFYDNAEDVLLAQKEFDGFRKAGDAEEMQRVLRDYGPQLQIAGFIKSIDRNLSNLRKRLKEVRANPHLSDSIREQMEQQIKDQQDIYIDQANRMYNRVVRK